MITLVVLSFTAVFPVHALAVWKDVSPNAYLNPYENPPLDSVYMFPAGSSVEGWAVGDFVATTNLTTGLPSIFHYDGSIWSLVPAPKFPDYPSTQCGYDLTSVHFGLPLHYISKNDGWAVGFSSGAAAYNGVACGVTAGTAVAIHWDGDTWRVQVAGLSGPDAGALNSVFMVSPTDVWAVGANNTDSPIAGQGTIWHWTGVPGLGGGWNLVQKVQNVLHSVYMVSPIEGWAVGDGGSIYHYYGGAWNAFASPIFTPLESVFMLSPTEGWAVGVGGMIVHYSTGIWSGPVSPGTTSNTLFSVFMISSTEGWATGGALSQANATIVHYTAGTWTAIPINMIPLSPVDAFSLNSVFFTTAADGWVVGTAGVIAHFDGSNWGTLTSPSLNNFTSVSFGPPLTGALNPNDGWIVGNASTGRYPLPYEPTIFHWNGFMWTKGIAIGATNNLNSVFMLSSGDVWAVGGGPRPTASCSASPVTLCPIILHFTGGAWNTVTPPSGPYTLRSIYMVSPTEGWAVGEQAVAPNPISNQAGIILHYTVTGNVGTWAIFPAPSSPTPPAPLNSVFMLNPNEGWAVGNNETILHYTVTGGVGSWNTVAVSGTPTLSMDANLTSIFMLSSTSGWAVGGVRQSGSFSAGPIILYWDGTKWTPVAAPSIPGGFTPSGHTSATLKTVFCQAPKNCWAAGLPGILFATLFHWDGISWTHIATSPALLGQIPPTLTSIYMTGPDSGWVVGGDPEFPGFLPQSFGGTTALSTILRSTQALQTTTTTAIIASATTATTILVGSTISTSTIITSVTSTSTVAPPPPPAIGSGAIWAVILLVVAAAILLVLIGLLFRRRRPPPAVCYPVQRRPYQ